MAAYNTETVQCSYYATLHIPQDAERSLLYFEGIQCKGIVNVNGEYAGKWMGFNSYVDISSIVEPGSEIDVNITLENATMQSLPEGYIC